MINFYYADPVAKVQYFVNVDSIENISEVKIKNAIAKEAVKGLVARIGNVSKEDQKTLTKRLKTSIYTGLLIENAGYTNIEIIGDFTKTVATIETIEIIDNNGTLKTVEAEKFNSKVLENVYIVKDGSFYNLYYKKVFLFSSKHKSDIENKLNENINRIEKHVNDTLVKFKFEAPATKDQLNTYKDELISDIEYAENRIKRMIDKNKDQEYIDIKINELNALKAELNLVELMLNDNTNNIEVVETPEIENKINTIDYVVYNKSFNSKQDAIKYCLDNDFDPELMIEKYVDGVKAVDTSINESIPINKVVNDLDNKLDKDIKKKIQYRVIEYFTQDKNVFDENIIDNEIKYIIDISKQIRNKLKYKNGVYYPVIELFEDIQLKDDYYKYFVMDALKVQDIEFYNSNELYRVCS